MNISAWCNPWLSRDEVRELDHRAIEEFGVPGIVLMENAGRGCAEFLLKTYPKEQPFLILCGPGNNGGDGFVIARHLSNHGRRVTAWLVGNKDKVSGDAATNFSIAQRDPMINASVGTGLFLGDISLGLQFAESVIKPDLCVVDALFGTGLTRPLETPYAEIVRIINAASAPVFAVDIPSGLDCDTGEPLGATVKATHTATFVAHKKGFTNLKSREWTGEVHVVDIGAPRVLVDEYRRRRAT